MTLYMHGATIEEYGVDVKSRVVSF